MNGGFRAELLSPIHAFALAHLLLAIITHWPLGLLALRTDLMLPTHCLSVIEFGIHLLAIIMVWH